MFVSHNKSLCVEVFVLHNKSLCVEVFVLHNKSLWRYLFVPSYLRQFCMYGGLFGVPWVSRGWYVHLKKGYKFPMGWAPS